MTIVSKGANVRTPGVRDTGDPMSKHKLDGAVEVDVTSVTSEFRGRAPEIEGVDRDRMLRFGRPKVIDPIVDIKFKFKATKHDSSIMFGVKQIVVIKEYQAL